MASVRKCPKCGLELVDTAAAKCPMCGAPILATQGSKIWIGALIQIAFSTVFMLVFRFPKIMILIFAAIILLGTALSAWLKSKRIAQAAAPQPTVSHPVGLRIVSIAIALSSFALFCILLFGFVMFINSWTRWHQYEGQPYHRDEFQVTRVYYQRGSKGSIDVYASGEVEDNREWMSLRPYLHSLPHSQGELESMVPAGTVIPVYFFPGMKGRMRVEVYADTPPAEANQRAAMTTLNHGLLGIAITGGLIFFLILLRRMCFAQ